ncbi:hypothetical protein QR685DRAFT_569457 [Neurospora intermedia]|uniref:Uncharacterized protein n=1 Tax=Neurospora intermedia TaxID=5142 RepID=A0ABR3DL39_NEUIN
MIQSEMIGRGCVEAKDETANAWSREEVRVRSTLMVLRICYAPDLDRDGRWIARRR